MGTHDCRAVDSRILVNVLQEVAIRHPRGYRTKLCNVKRGATAREDIGVDQPLPHSDLLEVPLRWK